MKPLNESTGMDIARRYLWFITYGYYTTVLNDPQAIFGEASPEYIDQLIQQGMEEWPKGVSRPPPFVTNDDDEPRVA
jgi:hypothetical protein